jgi:uncharacterized protein (DUF4415 family)
MSENRKFIKSDLKCLDQMKDIDYSDILELDESFFTKATVELPKPKDSITLRVDHDVLYWFKQFGKGYQTKMNAVLKAYVKAHQHYLRPHSRMVS